ncbi:MAG: 2-amino-4-hydroxy-6-hydroxymethyldihydropteridine diphosphokinase [Pseudomonadota bacterium]|nr:2-amino-4-hydroxy-6-hydroxymethyldihydropteridine diphosphokinase [Pseudomonadota bacterium]
MHPVRAYIGMGSNLQNPVAQVRQAFQALAGLPASRFIACSPLYRTAPVSGPPDQPDYVNAVAALDTALSPDELLTALQRIETSQGRVRTVRWGPRTLDLDLLLYDALQRDDSRLTLPHPRLHERAFVLYPLYDIAPDLTIPGRGPLIELRKNCPPLSLIRLDSPN